MPYDPLEPLCTREALRPFQPRPGDDGLAPMLEVRTADAITVFMLALDGFNDWETRRAAMYELGQHCAHAHPGVEVVRFGSEAWMRTFTEAEQAARGRRLVESYSDKQEVIMVFVQHHDGTLLLAHAPLHRRPTGKIERLGTWQVRQEMTGMRAPILEAFWEGYAQGKAREN